MSAQAQSTGIHLFQCVVGGDPAPTTRWLKDGDDITNDARYLFDHSEDGVVSLIIRDVTFADSGHYKCIAENSEGVASSSSHLVVKALKEQPDEPNVSVQMMKIDESDGFHELIMQESCVVSTTTALEQPPAADPQTDAQGSGDQDLEVSSPIPANKLPSIAAPLLQSDDGKPKLSSESTNHILPGSASLTPCEDSLKNLNDSGSENHGSRWMEDSGFYESGDFENGLTQDDSALCSIEEQASPCSVPYEPLPIDGSEENNTVTNEVTSVTVSCIPQLGAESSSPDLTEHVDVMQLTASVPSQAAEAIVNTSEKIIHSNTDLHFNPTIGLPNKEGESSVSAEPSFGIDAQINGSQDKARRDGNSCRITGNFDLNDNENDAEMEIDADPSPEPRATESESRGACLSDNAPEVDTSEPKSSWVEYLEMQTESTSNIQDVQHPEGFLIDVMEDITLLTERGRDELHQNNALRNNMNPVFSMALDQSMPILNVPNYPEEHQSFEGVIINDTDNLEQKVPRNKGEAESKNKEEQNMDSAIQHSSDTISNASDDISECTCEGYSGEVSYNTIESGKNKEDQRLKDDTDTTGNTHLTDASTGMNLHEQAASETQSSRAEVDIGPGLTGLETRKKDEEQGGSTDMSEPASKRLTEQLTPSSSANVELLETPQASISSIEVLRLHEEGLQNNTNVELLDLSSIEILESGQEGSSGSFIVSATDTSGETIIDGPVHLTDIVRTMLENGELELRLTATLQTPEFIQPPSDVRVRASETIILTCVVRGHPDPNVTWGKDDGPLDTQNNSHIQLTRDGAVHYLEISEARPSDGGHYTCTAKNSEGKVTATVTVTVEGASSSVDEGSEAHKTQQLLGQETSTTTDSNKEAGDRTAGQREGVDDQDNGAKGAEGGAEDNEVTQSSPRTLQDCPTLRYAKLVGMAAAFSLAVLGASKVYDMMRK